LFLFSDFDALVSERFRQQIRTHGTIYLLQTTEELLWELRPGSGAHQLQPELLVPFYFFSSE